MAVRAVGSISLSAMQADAALQRPDDDRARLLDRYCTPNRAAVQAAGKAPIDNALMRWAIVGDAKIVGPQLAAAGITFVTKEEALPLQAR